MDEECLKRETMGRLNYSANPDIKTATDQKKRNQDQVQFVEDDDMPGVQRDPTSVRIAYSSDLSGIRM